MKEIKVIAAAALLVTLAVVISVALYTGYVNAQRTQTISGYNTPYGTGPYGNGDYRGDDYGRYESAPNAPYGTYGPYPPPYGYPPQNTYPYQPYTPYPPVYPPGNSYQQPYAPYGPYSGGWGGHE